MRATFADFKAGLEPIPTIEEAKSLAAAYMLAKVVPKASQVDLLKKIRGGSVEEEFEALHRLAEELPLWKQLRKAKPRTAPRSKAPATKQRKTG